MRTCLVLLIGLLSAAVSGAPAWRWVDETGQVHYSDRPVAGAEQIELSGAQTFPSTRPSLPRVSETEQATQAPAAPTARYRRFDILSPTQQETLWNIGSVLPVQVAVEPSLQAGHHLDVYMDGQHRDLNATSAQFSVPEVFRGVHALQAAIVDANGNEVLRSAVVTFNVQQTSILNPNNPNAPARAN
jgi:hypothetical protein